MTKVNTGFSRYTNKKQWTCAFPGGLKSPTGPHVLRSLKARWAHCLEEDLGVERAWERGDG